MLTRSLTLFACVASLCAPIRAANYRIEQTRLATIPFPAVVGFERFDNVLSPDSLHLAYVLQEGDKLTVAVDGEQQGGSYDWIASRVFSPDSRRFVLVARRGEKWFAVVDGRGGPPYDRVGPIETVLPPPHQGFHPLAAAGTQPVLFRENRNGHYEGGLLFSPDSKRVCYVARKGEKWVAVVDGEESVEYDEIGGTAAPDPPVMWPMMPASGGLPAGGPGSMPQIIRPPGLPAFSPDSSRVGYVARHGDERVVVVDGEEYPAYDGAGGAAWVAYLLGPDTPRELEAGGAELVYVTGPVCFSSDGSHFAYQALRDGKIVIVVDGEEEAEYDKSHGVMFSLDGSHYAHWGHRERGHQATIDGRPLGHSLDRHRISFSSDGQHIAYVAPHGDGAVVVIDGRPTRPYDRVTRVMHSPDGSRLAYVAEKGGQWVVVVDGKEVPAGEGVGGLGFSPDSSRLLYAVRRDVKQVMVVDGEEGPELDRIERKWVTFSRNSRIVAYMAEKDGKRVYVANGQVGPPFNQVGPLVLTDDGAHFAYVGRLGPGFGDKAVFVRDGEVGPEFDTVRDPVLSPDGLRFAYIRGRDAGTVIREAVVVDGEVRPEYLTIESGPLFSPDGKHVAYVGSSPSPPKLLLDERELFRGSRVFCLFFIAGTRELVYFAIYRSGGDDAHTVIIDGSPGPECHVILSAPVIHEDGSLEYLAMQSHGRVSTNTPRTLYRVKHIPADGEQPIPIAGLRSPWEKWRAAASPPGREPCLVPGQGRNGSWALELGRSADEGNTGVYQSVRLNQEQPQPITARVWVKTKGVTGKPSLDCSLYIDAPYADKTPGWGLIVLPIQTAKDGWQLLEKTVVPPKPVVGLHVHLLFRAPHTGTALFDDLHVSQGDGGPNLVECGDFEPESCRAAAEELRKQDEERIKAGTP